MRGIQRVWDGMSSHTVKNFTIYLEEARWSLLFAHMCFSTTCVFDDIFLVYWSILVPYLQAHDAQLQAVMYAALMSDFIAHCKKCLRVSWCKVLRKLTWTTLQVMWPSPTSSWKLCQTLITPFTMGHGDLFGVIDGVEVLDFQESKVINHYQS